MQDLTNDLARRVEAAFFCLILLLLAYAGTAKAQASRGATADGLAGWSVLAEGLALKEVPVHNTGTITILRIDPRLYQFALMSAKAEDGRARSLPAWCQERALSAAINASMYLKDGQTSTGYMRQGTWHNNPRIAPRFGAFFVAGPDTETLPRADILSRSCPNITERLRHYHLVIQNYRLISDDRRILWPKDGERHAIASVGIDTQGSVLFLFCSAPLRPAEFAGLLLGLPIDLRTAMYVEGGTQAGLCFTDGARTFARTAVPFLEPMLPNVLGIRKITNDARSN